MGKPTYTVRIQQSPDGEVFSFPVCGEDDLRPVIIVLRERLRAIAARRVCGAVIVAVHLDGEACDHE